jgi:peroxiredoxin
VSATSPTIAEQVTALQAGMTSQVPPAALRAFGAEQAALRAAGTPDTADAVGAPMPDGELLDVHGNATTLARARQGTPAIVVFYRGAWCPFCNLALRAYQEQLAPALENLGVSFVAVSPQKPDGSLSMQEANELTFAVLSDPGNQIAGALGILTAPSDDARAAQVQLGLDLRVVNGDGTPGLPMPTVALVDAGGTLRWIDVHPDYTTRTEPTDVLAAVRTELGLGV